MNDATPNIVMPYIMAAQAQKHVTHNEAIRALDALVQLSVLDRDLATPPAAPSDGDRYIVAGSPTGVWSGHTNHVAAYQDNAWIFYTPRDGWLCWLGDENLIAAWDGTVWSSIASGGSTVSTTLNNSPSGASTKFELLEEELIVSGSFHDSVIQIPNRAIVFAVSTRTTQAITGAMSYDCGIAGQISKYGGTLAIAANSTNVGVTGPTAFYADTSVRLTANGSNFTGGKVRITIHCMLCAAPTL